MFSPKDKIADWLEMYARVMELNYCTSTVAAGARYDEDAGEWEVTGEREGAGSCTSSRSRCMTRCASVTRSSTTGDAVVLADGTELPADLVVYATGYGSMNGWAAELISPDVADRVGKVWGLYLALQLKARQVGIDTPVYGLQEVHHLA